MKLKNCSSVVLLCPMVVVIDEGDIVVLILSWHSSTLHWPILQSGPWQESPLLQDLHMTRLPTPQVAEHKGLPDHRDQDAVEVLDLFVVVTVVVIVVVVVVVVVVSEVVDLMLSVDDIKISTTEETT